ncbi:SAP7 Candidapepsin-7 [Candida maltosa Xu316]
MIEVLQLLLLSSTAMAVIGDGFISLPVNKIQTNVGTTNFPNRLPIFDTINGVAKSVQQDVNNVIQPFFGNGISTGSGTYQSFKSKNGQGWSYEWSYGYSEQGTTSTIIYNNVLKTAAPAVPSDGATTFSTSIIATTAPTVVASTSSTSSSVAAETSTLADVSSSPVEVSSAAESSATDASPVESSSTEASPAESSTELPSSQPSTPAQKETGAFFLNLNNAQTLYYATLKVGSPAQEVQVMIDTGSSDLWFISSENSQCQTNGGPIDCSKYGTYDKSSSSSWHDNQTDYSISYYDGDKATGTMGQDNITFAAGFSLENANFAVIDNTTSKIGVLGVGYPELEAVKPKYSNLPQAMKEQDLIAKVAYSLYLDSRHATQGYILFGGIDHAKYSGDLKSFDIVQTNGKYIYSQIPLTAVVASLNNYTDAYPTPPVNGTFPPRVGAAIYNGTDSFNGGVDLGNNPALLDTGTTYTYLPKTQVESIVKLFGNVTYNDVGKAYEMPCWVGNDGNYLEFNFQSEQYIQVPLSEFVISIGTDSNNVEQCVFGILPGTTSILGDNFMRSVYAVFDLDDNTISIAQAAFNDEHQIVPIE